MIRKDKKFILYILCILALFLFSGCISIWKTGNEEAREEEIKIHEVDPSTLRSRKMDKKYISVEHIDPYGKSNPIFFDESIKKFRCTKNNEITEQVDMEIEGLPLKEGVTVGPSRIAHYCKAQDIYWVMDYPGYESPSLYGPFKGYPR